MIRWDILVPWGWRDWKFWRKKRFFLEIKILKMKFWFIPTKPSFSLKLAVISFPKLQPDRKNIENSKSSIYEMFFKNIFWDSTFSIEIFHTKNEHFEKSKISNIENFRSFPIFVKDFNGFFVCEKKKNVFRKRIWKKSRK